jgi:hypothetical protein
MVHRWFLVLDAALGIQPSACAGHLTGQLIAFLGSHRHRLRNPIDVMLFDQRLQERGIARKIVRRPIFSECALLRVLI